MTNERSNGATPAEEPAPPPPRPQPAFEWMSQTREWGSRARPGKDGLTIAGANIGLYGEIPDVWDDLSRLPRGAFSVPGLLPTGNISLRSKAELWADDVPDLYEEAISRRWVPAKDVPWALCTPLPDDVEI